MICAYKQVMLSIMVNERKWLEGIGATAVVIVTL